MMTWLLLMSLLLPQAGGTISGEIRRADGTPATDVQVGVAALPLTSTNGITVLNRVAMTDQLGRYRLEDVAAGEYYVVAGSFKSLTYYPGTLTLTNARSVAVSPGVTINANFAVPSFQTTGGAPAPIKGDARISGKVVTEDGRRLPGFLPSLYVYAGNGTKTIKGADGGKIRGSGTFGATPVSKEGFFSLLLAEGEHEVLLITGLGQPLSAVDGYYVKSISLGDIDLLKEKLKVTGSSPQQTITITIAPTH